MAGNLFQFPKAIGWDAGVVQAGSKLTFTATGTTNAQNTFTDLALTVAHANPVIADSEGVFAPIYLDSTLPDYRVKYTDSANVLIYQVDDVPASQFGSSQTLTGTAPFLDFIETDGAANNTVWRLQVNSEQFLFRLGNDALSSFVNIFKVDRTANTVDSLDFLAATLTNNTNTIAEITKGSFTPTFTGFSADPSSPTVRWTKIGTMVFVLLSFGAGTSNATAFTITNWPSTIQADTRSEERRCRERV